MKILTAKQQEARARRQKRRMEALRKAMAKDLEILQRIIRKAEQPKAGVGAT